MNIYLDIDGVLLTKNCSLPANNLEQFVKYLVNNHDVYWLTTHCKGDATYTVNYLKMYLPEPVISLLSKVRPTMWDLLKTDAIDLTQPFIWFDDYLMQIEKQYLMDSGVFDSWVEVDLKRNSDQLNEILSKLKKK